MTAFRNSIDDYASLDVFEEKSLSEQARAMEKEMVQAVAKGADELDRVIVRYGTAAMRRAISQKDLSMWGDYHDVLGALGTVTKSAQAQSVKIFTWLCGGRDENMCYVKENSFLVTAKVKGVRVWGFKKDCGKQLALSRKLLAEYGRNIFTLDIRAPKKEDPACYTLAKSATAFLKKYLKENKKTGEELSFTKINREAMAACGVDVDKFLDACKELARAFDKMQENADD